MIWIDLLAARRAAFNAKFGAGEAQSIFRIIREDVLQEQFIPMHKPLDEEDQAYLNKIFDDILEGQPVQYVIGLALFDEMKLEVNPAVLIPRPETEELLVWARELINIDSAGNFLDVGTGSGCLALGLKKSLPEAKVHAVDRSSEALTVAEANSNAYNLPLILQQMNFLEAENWKSLPQMQGIISNPPYIPFKEFELMGESVREHEPSLALMVPDEDPLQFYRAIGTFALENLVPNGWVLVEINEYFGQETVALFEELGLREVELRKDMSGKDRMVGAKK